MKVAVIIPCLNEELTVAKVVTEARRYLPEAQIYVLDNGSVDQTANLARASGAEVIHSPLKGKGNVLRHAFRVITADYYVMIDGDGTYPMDQAQKLISLAQDFNYEMVMGARLQLGKPEAFRPLHYLGNRLFTLSVRLLFGFPVQDLLTGFRVFSSRFTDEINLISTGFEVETELTIRAMAQDMAFYEIPIPYQERPAGSHSKLRTFRDGWKISLTILRFLRDFRPLAYFSGLAAIGLALSFCFGPPLQNLLLQTCALIFSLGVYFDTTLSRQRLNRRFKTPVAKSKTDRFAA